jgi:hypothetical protein
MGDDGSGDEDDDDPGDVDLDELEQVLVALGTDLWGGMMTRLPCLGVPEAHIPMSDKERERLQPVIRIIMKTRLPKGMGSSPDLVALLAASTWMLVPRGMYAAQVKKAKKEAAAAASKSASPNGGDPPNPQETLGGETPASEPQAA